MALEPSGQTTPLEARLRSAIAADGPLRLDAFMALCLLDRSAGSYARGQSLGAEGDFLTAPEASPLFGEALGFWLLDRWQGLGRPSGFCLVEAGPGRGLLMHDALRVACQDPGFAQALSLYLLEASAALRAEQAERLANHQPHFIEDLEALPDQPFLLLANEFLDALPVRQARQGDKGWQEVQVGLDAQGDLVLGLVPLVGEPPRGGPELAEWSPAVTAFAERLINRMARYPSAAMLIDYGILKPKLGWSLQAVRRHKKVGLLDRPGEADLSAHVDFAELIELASGQGLDISASSQAEALKALGIEALAQGRAKLQRGLERLLDPQGMGGFVFLSLDAPAKLSS